MPSRRRLLRAVVPAVGLPFAGCLSDSGRSRTATTTLGPPPTGPAPHLGERHKIRNDDDRAHEMVVTIAEGDRVLAREEYRLQVGEHVGLNNPIESQGRYTVRVELDGEPARTATWLVARCENHEYFQVYVGPDGGVEVRKLRETIDPPPTCTSPTTDALTRRVVRSR